MGVQTFHNVKMENNGISTHTLVIVPWDQNGMEHIVLELRPATMEKF